MLNSILMQGIHRLRSFVVSRLGSVAAGFVLIALLVWMAGSYIGLVTAKSRLTVIGILFGLFVIYFAINLLIDRSRGKRLARELQSGNSSGSEHDKSAEINALRKQTNAAIAALKASDLGSHRRGSAALYALPWYMVIGQPAAGKSTILRNSGLNFPYNGHDPAGIQGVGGTRTCDWWFSDEGIFIDTAGRYVTEEEDKVEWLAFLDMLRKNRRRQPINGVMVAVSINELLTVDVDSVTEQARLVRDRIHELIVRLGVVFPVYVVFTKCDLVRGFSAFFDDMSDTDRQQVWGSTLLHRTDILEKEPGDIFLEEFDALYERVCSQRLHKMSTHRDLGKKIDIVDFPNQLKAAASRLEEYIQQVFDHTPYQQAPRFSGFFFTSGAQEGRPVERVVGSVVDAFGAAATRPETENREQKPFFIHKLLKDVILPNSRAVTRNRKSDIQYRWLKRTAVTAAGVVIAAGVMIYTSAFTRQVIRVDNAGDVAARLSQSISHGESRQKLILDLEEYYAITAPFWSDSDKSWYLFEPSGFETPLIRNFMHAMEKTFLVQVATSLEQRMNDYVSLTHRTKNVPKEPEGDTEAVSNEATADAYDALKLYLFLSNPSLADASEMKNSLVSAWMRALKTEGVRVEKLDEDNLADMVTVYINGMQLEEGSPGFAKAWRGSKDIVIQARSALRSVPSADRLYADLLDLGRRHLRPVTISTLAGDDGKEVFQSSYTIPGIFSKKGWNEVVLPYIGNSSESLVKNDWVLGHGTDSENREQKFMRAQLVTSIRKMYFSDYANHWFAMLTSIKTVQYESLSDASVRMQTMVQSGGPLPRLLDSVLTNTRIFDPDAGLIDIARNASIEQDNTVLVEELRKPFGTLVTVLLDGLSGKADNWYGRYAESLEKVKQDTVKLAASSDTSRDCRQFAAGIMQGNSGSELYKSWLIISKVVEQGDERAARALGNILGTPIRNLWVAILDNAKKDIERNWKDKVEVQFVSLLEGRYPFSAKGRDSAFNDVIDFFRPESGIFWSFVNKDMKPFIERRNGKWVPRLWVGEGIRFSANFLGMVDRTTRVTNSLFNHGTSKPRLGFAIYPYPIAGVSESSLNVDGEQYRYRNGPQEWRKLTWPGDNSGASVNAVRAGSSARGEISSNGMWGWLKLLDRARKSGDKGNSFVASWTVRDTSGGNMSVRFRIRPDSHNNPFRNNVLRGYQLPQEMFDDIKPSDMVETNTSKQG